MRQRNNSSRQSRRSRRHMMNPRPIPIPNQKINRLRRLIVVRMILRTIVKVRQILPITLILLKRDVLSLQNLLKITREIMNPPVAIPRVITLLKTILMRLTLPRVNQMKPVRLTLKMKVTFHRLNGRYWQICWMPFLAVMRIAKIITMLWLKRLKVLHQKYPMT
ncbi:Uncharacterised protein [Enterobacter hormaechei]|nr:Uncharacterised protein [Enterobacter hormaechei]